MKWLRDVIRAHYYGDPLTMIMSDLAIVLFATFGVLLIRYQVTHHGHLPW